ncbi:hyaluronidase-like [Argopecten irradians]|uniref:hyaluronidase-like n=1 Tax=Argopecten irradians TaxID=31199 RepID=UPI00371A4146
MNVSCLASVIFSLLASLRLYFGIPPQPTPPVVPFTVVWNVPSAVCHDKYNVSLNLSRYGITHNDNESFFGKEMVLFYEPTPGLYPKYLRNGSAINGGLPQFALQKSNIEKHVRKVELDIQQTIRGAEFSGLAVVDWESWRPIFDRNIYDKITDSIHDKI